MWGKLGKLATTCNPDRHGELGKSGKWATTGKP